MGRQKKPIELLQKQGKSHKTKAEIEERKKTEIKGNNDNISAPDFLEEEEQIKEFYQIAEELKRIGIMTNLDSDVLGQYIQSKASYVYYSKAVKAFRAATMRKDSLLTAYEAVSAYEILKEKAFKQCQTCANALGLNITSRCKLVAPKSDEKPPENKFAKFQKCGSA